MRLMQVSVMCYGRIWMVVRWMPGKHLQVFSVFISALPMPPRAINTHPLRVNNAGVSVFFCLVMLLRWNINN